ncbi:hypothetical protein [Candidatus Vidania fulgoroideorum]
MIIRFIKASSYGNDFMLISKNDITRKEIYDRNIGVGFDQVLTFKYIRKNIFRCIIRNKDITTAYNCFNGLRCLSLYLGVKTKIRKLYIVTKGGNYKFIRKGRKIKTIIKLYKKDFRTNMRFLYRKMFFRNILNIKQINLLLTKIYFSYIDIGNKHIITFLKERHKSKAMMIKRLITKEKVFNQDPNISIFNIKNKNITTLERGSGITLSCGTGTMASCIVLSMKMRYREIKILSSLGIVVFKKKEKCLSTIGKVCFSYSGKTLLK